MRHRDGAEGDGVACRFSAPPEATPKGLRAFERAARAEGARDARFMEAAGIEPASAEAPTEPLQA
jgi:hypothetical protein